MACVLLFALLLRGLISYFIVITIKYQRFCKFFLKFDLSHLWLATEVGHSQVYIHFHHSQKECKDTVRPIFCFPDNFQTLSVSVVYCCDHPLSVNTRNGCPRLWGNEISFFWSHSHLSIPILFPCEFIDWCHT